MLQCLYLDIVTDLVLCKQGVQDLRYSHVCKLESNRVFFRALAVCLACCFIHMCSFCSPHGCLLQRGECLTPSWDVVVGW